MRISRLSRISLALLAAGLLAGRVPAQSAPNLLHFQARLVDNDAGPLSGSTAVTVRVYDVPSGGAPLWQEQQTVSAANGIVDMLLGSQTPLPLPLFDGSERYLALQVGNDAEMTPRLPMAATPFARRAASADDVPGRNITPNSVTVNGVPVIDSQGRWVGSTTGLAGSMGPLGPAGPQGSIGPQGPEGPQGTPGPGGSQGLQGLPGPVGPKGESGAPGAIGATGEVGPQGPQGEVGPRGGDGAPGATGAVGAVGPVGPQGEVGPVGPQGDVGPQGVIGPQGEMGPQGELGPEGTVGPIGPQGLQGEVGPRGADGAPGATGAVGPVGPQGEVGPAGVIGPQGPQGATGAVGPQGPQGEIGPVGLQGIQGDIGPAGPQGPVGPQGAAGPAGAQGAQGTSGVVGNAFGSGAGSSPGTTLAFLSPTTTVTITAGQKILVVASKAFGSTTNGAGSLDLSIGYRLSNSTAVPSVVGTIAGNRIAKESRVTFSLNGIVSGLAAGTYTVGLAGLVTSSADAAKWNSNGGGTVSALVFN